MTWFEVLLYANLKSAAHEPPLQQCYILEDCKNDELESRYSCKKVSMPTASVYDCTGYRLPTRAEWQYAARAGTTTSYYSGNITVTEADEGQGCAEDPNLNPIAWYCYNSWTEARKVGDAHPVGLKWPNAWGLYDMLGNVSELLHEPDHARSPKFPALDPFGEIGKVEDGRPSVGGEYVGWPSLARAAAGLQASPGIGTPDEGFRLVRTLGAEQTKGAPSSMPAELR
jgi:formylglycine-generating enzyme required for sulfatase activity